MMTPLCWRVCATIFALGTLVTAGHAQTHYTHDELNRLSEVAWPDGKVERFTYDAAGNILRIVATTSGTGSQSKLPHTGITELQCYAAGSNALISCSSPGAIALSGAGKQDGMYTNLNPMSYSAVGSYTNEECVKDKVTGLMWEGKTAGGLRAGGNTYTNWGDGRSGDASTYAAAVNAMALCSYTDWRLPTVDELETLVDVSKPAPGPTIRTDWFVNTASAIYWTSWLYLNNPNDAWGVGFDSGGVDGYGYDRFGSVRLVRGGQ
jgi:YD repeat-containing protein